MNPARIGSVAISPVFDTIANSELELELGHAALLLPSPYMPDLSLEQRVAAWQRPRVPDNDGRCVRVIVRLEHSIARALKSVFVFVPAGSAKLRGLGRSRQVPEQAPHRDALMTIRSSVSSSPERRSCHLIREVLSNPG